MKISTGSSTNIKATDAVNEAWQQLTDTLNAVPRLLICSASANYPADQLQAQLTKLAPENCQIAGSSSCLGAMNDHGFHSQNSYGLSLIAFAEDEGDFGVALSDQMNDPTAAAAMAINQAINNADRPGELPELIWLSTAPGNEEIILAGIASVVGKEVPVIGGSSADNTISGEWWQFCRERVENNGILVIAMYPDCQIGLSLQSGYAPTNYSGLITKADGRTIYTIDNQPAAQVYNQWSNGLIESQLLGGNILQETTFHPLGREAGSIENIPYYALLHPDQVLDNGAISLFSNVSTGDQLTLMQGSPESLTSRAGTVVNGIIERQNWKTDQLAGALVVYCAGCMLGIRERMDKVSQGIHNALGGAPYHGMFTFGEQGCFIDGANHHANLMIAVVIFANRAD